MVPPPPSMVSRTSFSEPRTPLACRSTVIDPPDSSSTFSLNAVSVCPTIVSSGLTSAITRVTAGPTGSPASALASSLVSSFASAAVVASSLAASVAAAVVAVSGDFNPHPASDPATIAVQSAALNHLFFILFTLLLMRFSHIIYVFLRFLYADFIIRVKSCSDHGKFLIILV